MATLTLANPYYYRTTNDGKTSGGVTAVLGKESASNVSTYGWRVGRYEFTSPADGANHISFRLHYGYIGEGSAVGLRFYIGTDAESHKTGNPSSEYTGNVSFAKDGDVYTFTGEADIVLLPNTKYYLWLFPRANTWGWYGAVFNEANRTVTVGGTSIYVLDIQQSMGAVITVTRNGEALLSGAAILHGDLLTVSYGVKGGYKLTSHTLNGADFPSGDDHVVVGAVTVAAVAIPLAVRIGGNLYCIYIGTGNGKQMYVAKIGRNGKWVPYPGA